MSDASPPPEDPFRTDHLQDGLRGRAVRSGAITVGAQALKFAARLLSTAALARLLTPDDFGLVAMVTAVTGFVALFKDLGLSMATVQRSEIDHRQVSTLFWINLSLSVATMALVVWAAPAVAEFYDDARLEGITQAVAAALLLGGMGVQHQALLRRQMEFGSLARVELSAFAIGAISAVGAALAGAGYWALVVQQIVETAVSSTGLWIACRWRPGPPSRRAGVGAMLSFGSNLTGFRIANYSVRNLDNILIGRFVGSSELGLYTRAYRLLLLPLQQVNRPMSAVAIPTLSKLQNDPVRYRHYYRRAVNVLAYLTLPGILSLVAFAEPIILVVLGEQWLGAAAIFRVLGVAALLQPIGNSAGWIYTSLGQTDRMFRWGLMSSPLLVISFAIGLPWGALGVATAYAVVVNLLLVPLFRYALAQSPVEGRDVAEAVWRPLVAATLVLVAELAVRSFTAEAGLAASLTASAGAGLATFALFVAVLPGARTEVRELLEMLGSLRERKY